MPWVGARHGLLRCVPPAASSSQLPLRASSRFGHRDIVIDGFVPPATTVAPMFPFYEKSAEWDDYGEVINPDDYIIKDEDMDQPSLQVLVHGSTEATEHLKQHCTKHVCPHVYAQIEETIDVTSDLCAYKLGKYEIAWVDAEVGKTIDMRSLLPLTSTPPTHNSVLVGDLKLADFKQFLAGEGIQKTFAEYIARTTFERPPNEWCGLCFESTTFTLRAI